MPEPKLTIHVDGGARGNPGPAAAGVVITDAAGHTLFAAGYFLGRATNNVAEYQGLIRGLQQGRLLGASEVEVLSDSELLVMQMTGKYRVKADHLVDLYWQARQAAGEFERCSFRHVRREFNKQADTMVNQALDAKASVGDAGS